MGIGLTVGQVIGHLLNRVIAADVKAEQANVTWTGRPSRGA